MSKQQQDTVKDFQTRAKLFLQDLELAQIKHGIIARPIITTFGPDLQLSDKLAQPEPVKPVEKV